MQTERKSLRYIGSSESQLLDFFFKRKSFFHSHFHSKLKNIHPTIKTSIPIWASENCDPSGFSDITQVLSFFLELGFSFLHVLRIPFWVEGLKSLVERGLMAVAAEVLRRNLPEISDGSSSGEIHVLAVDDSLVDRKVIERLLKISSCKGEAFIHDLVFFRREWNICGFFFLISSWLVLKFCSDCCRKWNKSSAISGVGWREQLCWAWCKKQKAIDLSLIIY